MLDRGYRKRLAADLPKWRESGWVSEEGAAAILDTVPAGRPVFSFAAIVATLGGLLVGLGVVAFVSANWQDIPRLSRFALLAAGMAVAYVAAGALERRNLRVFAEVALLVAGLVFAAAIALVGQSYHLSGAFSEAVFLWLIGIFAAAVLTASPTMTVLGLIGGAFWTWTVTIDLGAAPHWAGLWPVVAGGAIAVMVNSRNTRVLAVLALLFWIALAIGSTADRLDWSFAGSLALCAGVALALFALGALLASLGRTRLAALGHDMLWPTLVAVLLSVGIEQAADDPSVGEQMLTATAAAGAALAVALAAIAWLRRGLGIVDVAGVALIGGAAILFAVNVPESELWARAGGGAMALVAALWAVGLGQAGRVPAAKTTGLVALGAEIIYLYVATLGSLMNTAVAFLIGGVLFMVLAWAIYRLDRLLDRRTGGGAPA